MTCSRALLLILPLLAISCSSPAPQKTKEEKKPAEPVAARKAFQQAYLSARTWAQDLQVLRMRNLIIEGVPVTPGKSLVWEVTFVSPGKSRARRYIYSLVEQGNIHEGVLGGPEEAWSGRDGQATAFLIAAFRTDSVDAWETAAAKSKEYMQKYPDLPISFLLEKTPRHPDPTWRVIWGTSVASSGYSIYVDATTGEFLERMR
jgi:hypothetical protein